MKNKLEADYSAYQKLGATPEEAARMANMAPAYASAFDKSRRLTYAPEFSNYAGFGNGVYSPTEVRGATNHFGMNITAEHIKSMHPEGIDTDRSWYSSLIDTVMAAGETFAIPQQLMFQKMAGGDWREAIPDWIAPDSWKDEGIEYEMMRSGQVLDHYIEGGYGKLIDRLNEGNFAEKWMLGGFLKTAEFGVDVVFDPMNIVIGAGVGKAAVNLARRTLPVAARAEQTAALAAKTGFVGDIDDAIKVHKEWVKKLAKDTASPEGKRRLSAAVDQYKGLVRDKRYYLDKNPGDTLMEMVPAARPQDLAKPGKGATIAEKQRYAARLEAAKHNQPLVRFEDMDNETFALRAALGPDDAEVASESLYRVLLGADPDVDIIVRNLMDDVAPASTSVELRPFGVGRDGHATEEVMRSQKIMTTLEDFTAHAETQVEALTARLNGVKASAKMTAKQKAGQEKYIKSQIDIYKNRSRLAKNEMKTFGETGQYSPKLATDLGLQIPNGPRRNILKAADFADTAGERIGTRLFTPALYPGSIMPKATNGFVSYFFREPMRVLESHMPGAWAMVRGSQRQKEAFLVGTMGKFKRVLGDAGVLLEEGAARKALKATGVDLGRRVNKDRSRQLFKLLDTDPNEVAFKDLWDAAPVEIQKAHDEIRKVFNELATRLGVAPDKKISGYAPHLLKKEWFSKGNFAQEFTGVRKVGNTPWFLKQRVGEAVEIDDIVEVLDAYTRGAGKYLYTDPVVDAVNKMAMRTAKATGNKWLVGYAESMGKNMRGEASLFGQFLNALPFQGLHNAARKSAAAVGTLTYSAALTGNIRYPIMSIVQAINATGAEFGMLRTLKGLAKASTAEGRVFTKAVGLADEHARMFETFHGTWSQMASSLRPLGFSINDTEAMIRGITFHTALDEYLTKYGAKTLGEIKNRALQRELIAKAVRDSESINHVFGSLGKPVWMGRVTQSGSALATQFFSFPFKQTETIVNNSMKNPGYFVDYLLMAGQMQNIAAKANLDITAYTGIGYADAMARDMTSIPVDVMLATANWVQAEFNYTAPQDVKEDARANLKKSLEMLKPMKVAIEQRKKMVSELSSGMRRGGTGSLKRHLDLNLSGTGKGTAYGAGNEFLSIVTRLDSIQQMRFDREYESKRLAKGKQRATTMKIAAEIRDSVQGGSPVDMNKLNQLSIELSRTGQSLSTTDLMKMFEKEESLYLIEERLRDDEFEYDARSRGARLTNERF